MFAVRFTLSTSLFQRQALRSTLRITRLSSPLPRLESQKPHMAPIATAPYTTVQEGANGNPPVHLPVSRLFSTEGKTAICTGVTGGLGKELCTTLAEAGCDIVSIQLKGDPAGPMLEKAVKTLGRDFKSFDCDVGDSQALRTCFQEIWTSGVKPDIMLNAAGINRRGTIEILTDEDIDAVGKPNVCAQTASD